MAYNLVGSTNIGVRSQLAQYYGAPTSNVGMFGILSTTANTTFPNYGNTNINIDAYNNANYYMFYFQIYNTNGTKGRVGISQPWSEFTDATNGRVGFQKQAYGYEFTTITIYCSVNYPYTFKGWYDAASGGNQILGPTFSTADLFYNATTSIWYAQYN